MEEDKLPTQKRIAAIQELQSDARQKPGYLKRFLIWLNHLIESWIGAL